MAHRFDPKKLSRLENPERARWQSPDAVFAALGLGPGQVFLDVGCGPGFFSLPAAGLVGAAGKVYGADIEPAMLGRLQERAGAAGLANVFPVQSGEDTLPLPDALADTALICNVLHEVEYKVVLLQDIGRVLKIGGKLAVVEWKKEQTEKGPPVGERLAPSQVEALLTAAGFSQLVHFAAGPYHYGVLAIWPPE